MAVFLLICTNIGRIRAKSVPRREYVAVISPDFCISSGVYSFELLCLGFFYVSLGHFHLGACVCVFLHFVGGILIWAGVFGVCCM